MKTLVTSIGSASASHIIATLRSLGAEEISGTDLNPGASLYNSCLVDHFHQVPAASSSCYVDVLYALCVENNIELLVPLTDPEVDKLCQQIEAFSQIGCTICCPDPQFVLMARDKLAWFNKLGSQSGIKIPGTDSLTANFRVKRKSLLKPRWGRSSEGVAIVSRQSDLEQILPQIRGQEYIVQEYIPGDIFVADCLRDRESDMVVSVVRQELTRTPNGMGMTVEVKGFHELEETAGRLARALGLHGFANFEFIMNDGLYYLIDINPRPSAGIEFSSFSGYAMAQNFINFYRRLAVPAKESTVTVMGYSIIGRTAGPRT